MPNREVMFFPEGVVVVTNSITLAWDFNPMIICSFNLWHSSDLKSWSILTNTVAHHVIVPVWMANEMFAVTATNQDGESTRAFKTYLKP